MGTFTLALKKVISLEDGNIGLNDYPIFDEEYREALNQKIINHYWNQEIGQESIELFRFALRRRMHEIMPLYNQHYQLGLVTVDPLSTMSVHSIIESGGTSVTTGTSTNSANSGAKSRAVASETPQTALQPDADYATSMQDNVSDTTSAGSATDNQNAEQTGNQESTTSGYSGHAPMLILAARQALVNVDMMVINELQDLFMLIWSNNDSYSGKRYTYYGLY